MRAASIVGIFLVILGIASLAYYADPVRIMIKDIQPHKSNLVPPIVGGLALVCGMALLFAVRRSDKP